MFYDELNIIRYRLYSILRTPKYNFDLIKAKRKGYNDIYKFIHRDDEFNTSKYWQHVNELEYLDRFAIVKMLEDPEDLRVYLSIEHGFLVKRLENLLKEYPNYKRLNAALEKMKKHQEELEI